MAGAHQPRAARPMQRAVQRQGIYGRRTLTPTLSQGERGREFRHSRGEGGKKLPLPRLRGSVGVGAFNTSTTTPATPR